MKRKKLPIGIQSFAKLREDGCYYVDKTPFILRLIDEGSQYFLSRPRRFGKSLLLDTIAELFAGNEPLFRGLAAHDRWDWERRHPVIRLSFGGGMVQDTAGLELKIRVYQSLNGALLEAWTPDVQASVRHRRSLHRLLLANDFPGLEQLFASLFAGIASDWHRNNPIHLIGVELSRERRTLVGFEVETIEPTGSPPPSR